MTVIVQSRSLRMLMRAVEYVLLASGAGALGCCLFLVGSAYFYQQQQARNLDLAIENFKSRTHHVELPPASPVPAPLENGAVLGRLMIPRLGLKVMVIEGDGADDLSRAAGHIPGTALPAQHGNIGIAAHRDTYFRPLRNIHENDTIQLITPEREYTYRVVSTQIVDPSDVAVLNPENRDTLTLVTCYPFYYVGHAPKRFIVRAAKS